MEIIKNIAVGFAYLTTCLLVIAFLIWAFGAMFGGPGVAFILLTPAFLVFCWICGTFIRG